MSETDTEQATPKAVGAEYEDGEPDRKAEKEPNVKEKSQRSDSEEPEDNVPIVLVTGASGYVASHIIRQLLEQARFRVRGTVRNIENEKKIKPLRELVAEPKYPLRLIEADLQNSKSWIEAVRRSRYVIHVASPFPPNVPKNAQLLVKPAVEGTLNVLKACSESGTVKRVVLTSSIAAVSSGTVGVPQKAQDYVYTEEDWSDTSTCPPYELSKYRAESSAWDFMKALKEDKLFELVAVCPGLVMGPILSTASGETSTKVCSILLSNAMPGIPDIGVGVIDVRDAAAAHIAAIEKPEAAGNRYLLVGNETVTMKRMAEILTEEFTPQGYKIPKRGLPKVGMWLAKMFDPFAKMLYPSVGKSLTWSNEKMKGELGIEPRPIEETMIDMGYSIIEFGLVQKKSGYRGHPNTHLLAVGGKNKPPLPEAQQPSNEQYKPHTNPSAKDSKGEVTETPQQQPI